MFLQLCRRQELSAAGDDEDGDVRAERKLTLSIDSVSSKQGMSERGKEAIKERPRSPG